jgi:hypothetical protein
MTAAAKLRRPCCWRRGPRRSLCPLTRAPSFPRNKRGAERREAHRSSASTQTDVTACLRLRDAARAIDAGAPASRRSTAAILSPWCRASRRGTEGSSPSRSGGLPPSFVPATSSHSRQPVIVPAGGWPGPPGAAGDKPQQQAPHPAPPSRCLWKAPFDERDGKEYNQTTAPVKEYFHSAGRSRPSRTAGRASEC